MNNTPIEYNQPIELIEHDEGLIAIDPYTKWKSQIYDYTQLPHNWDGEGSLPLIDEISEKAKIFIATLNGTLIDKIRDVYPNSHGTLTIEWLNSKNEIASLEIGKNNYSYFIKYNNKEPKLVNRNDILADINQITQDLVELFAEEVSVYFF